MGHIYVYTFKYINTKLGMTRYSSLKETYIMIVIFLIGFLQPCPPNTMLCW